jgi:hypothetical protein
VSTPDTSSPNQLHNFSEYAHFKFRNLLEESYEKTWYQSFILSGVIFWEFLWIELKSRKHSDISINCLCHVEGVISGVLVLDANFDIFEFSHFSPAYLFIKLRPKISFV